MNIKFTNSIKAFTIVMAFSFSVFNVNAENEFGIPDAKLGSIESKIESMSPAQLRVARSALTEEQAKAILEMKLQRLTALEKGKIDNELAELAKTIQQYLELLFSDEKLMSLIKE